MMALFRAMNNLPMPCCISPAAFFPSFQQALHLVLHSNKGLGEGCFCQTANFLRKRWVTVPSRCMYIWSFVSDGPIRTLRCCAFSKYDWCNNSSSSSNTNARDSNLNSSQSRSTRSLNRIFRRYVYYLERNISSNTRKKMFHFTSFYQLIIMTSPRGFLCIQAGCFITHTRRLFFALSYHNLWIWNPLNSRYEVSAFFLTRE